MKPCKLACTRCGDFVRMSTDEELKRILGGGLVWAACEKCIENAKFEMEKERYQRYQVSSLQTPMYAFVDIVRRIVRCSGDVDMDIEKLSEAFIQLMETYEEVK